MQSTSSLPQSQVQGNNLGFVPPRSGPTPQHPNQPGPQQTGSPFNPLQPALGGQFAISPNTQPAAAGPSQQNSLAMAAAVASMINAQGGLIPLEKSRFDAAYKAFCVKRNVKPEQRLLSIENRQIDLYRLHVEVIKEGGVNKVGCFFVFLWICLISLTSLVFRSSRRIYGTSSVAGSDMCSFLEPRRNRPKQALALLNSLPTSTRNIFIHSSNFIQLRPSRTTKSCR